MCPINDEITLDPSRLADFVSYWRAKLHNDSLSFERILHCLGWVRSRDTCVRLKETCEVAQLRAPYYFDQIKPWVIPAQRTIEQ